MGDSSKGQVVEEESGKPDLPVIAQVSGVRYGYRQKNNLKKKPKRPPKQNGDMEICQKAVKERKGAVAKEGAGKKRKRHPVSDDRVCNPREQREDYDLGRSAGREDRPA